MKTLVALLSLLLAAVEAGEFHSLGGLDALGGHKGIDGDVLAPALESGYSHEANAHHPKVVEVVKHVPHVVKEVKYIPPPVPVVKHVTYLKSTSVGGHGGHGIGGHGVHGIGGHGGHFGGYGHGGISHGLSGHFIHFGHHAGHHKGHHEGYPIAVSGHLPLSHHH